MLRFDRGSGGITELLAAIEAGARAELPAMPAHCRPGVVTSLAILMTVLRLYAPRPGPWPAAAWRACWDEQLGPETRRLMAPLGEPALFQPMLERPAEAKRLALEDAAAFCGIEHELKSREEADPDAWIWAILGGTWRPHANFHRPTVRASQLVVLPSDGSLGSEVRALATAFQTIARKGRSAREHLPWLGRRPTVPTELAALPQPVLDLERTIRLVGDGRHAVFEPSNATWVSDKQGGAVDPHAAARPDGKTIRPYRAKSLGYRVLHRVLSGDETTRPPRILGIDHELPMLRIVQLAGENGKTAGYHEVMLAAPARVRRSFLLAARGESSRPKDLSDAFLRSREAARKEKAQIGALVAMRTSLSTAFRMLMTDGARTPYASEEAEIGSRLGEAEAQAGERSVHLLLELLDREPDPVAEQQAIHGLAREAAEKAFERAIEMPWPPLQAARAHRRLRRSLSDQLPLPTDETGAPMPRPALLRQSHAALAAVRLSPPQKATIRGTSGGGLPFVLVTALASAAPREEQHGPASEAWLLILRALGSLSLGGSSFGRSLGETRYPELRMNQLCAAGGEALRDLVGEALRWLAAHGVRKVGLADALALMRADALGRTEDLAWLRRELALDFVRAKDAQPRKSPPKAA